MKKLVWGAITLAWLGPAPLYAQVQSNDLNDLKARIFEANLAKQTFTDGLKFCKDLDGTTTFYFQARSRVLNLADYHRSLQNLAREQTFNPETKKPWTEQDANTHWEQAQKEAAKDKSNCDLIASLPFLEKKLQELQSKSQASDK
jgi:hypothetical protein